MSGGDDDLASSAAVSASDLDLAFQLQLAEAIQASLCVRNIPNNPGSSSSSEAAAPALPESSDAAYALVLHTADLAHAKEDHCNAQACHAANARAATSVHIATHDALFARELAAISEDQWAHDGDYLEHPLDTRPLFRVFFKGVTSKEVVGPRDRDPGVAVLVVAVCGPQGEVVLRIQKPVEGYVGGRMTVEVMALTEGLHMTLGLGIRSLNIVTDYKVLHNHV